jgi:hypothetical protein
LFLNRSFSYALSVLIFGTSLCLNATQCMADSSGEDLSGEGYGLAGCGLGSVVIGPKPGAIQILAGTTNYAFGNQTFAITSGTSNCVGETDTSRAEFFIRHNKLALQSDVARGAGETIASLAALFGCHDSSQLGRALQSRFTDVFPHQDVSDEIVAKQILLTIGSDRPLAMNCHREI